jgi:hypothetical protein
MLGINLEIDGIVEMNLQNTTDSEGCMSKQSRNKQISIIIISVYYYISIYVLLSRIMLKREKNINLKMYKQIQENIYNASINGQELKGEKSPPFYMMTLALYYHLRDCISVFSS